MLDSESGFTLPLPLLPQKRFLYYTFGPNYLYRKLDRVGSIDFGGGNARNSNTNASKSPGSFENTFSKDPGTF